MGMEKGRDEVLRAMLLHIMVAVLPVQRQMALRPHGRSLPFRDMPYDPIIALLRIDDAYGTERAAVPRLPAAFRIEDSAVKREAAAIAGDDGSIAFPQIRIPVIKHLRHCHFSSPTILATGSLHLKWYPKILRTVTVSAQMKRTSSGSRPSFDRTTNANAPIIEAEA